MITKCTYDDDNLILRIDGVEYLIKVHAKATYYYQTQTYWEPEDESFDIDSVDALWYKDGVEITPTDEMSEQLENWLYNNDNRFQGPEEPDYEEDRRDF